ncbi:MAG: hypothetical protein AB7G17_01805 [Phycisphaerales bacterium]
MSFRGDEFVHESAGGEPLGREVEALLDALAEGALREEDERRLYAIAERDARVARAVATTVWMTEALREPEVEVPDIAGRVLAETSKRRGAWLNDRGMLMVRVARVAAVVAVLGMVGAAMLVRRAAPESAVMRPVETPLTDVVRAGVSEVRLAASLMSETPSAVRFPSAMQREWTPARIEAARTAALASLRLPGRVSVTERVGVRGEVSGRLPTGCSVSEPDLGCFRAVWVAPSGATISSASPASLGFPGPGAEKSGNAAPVVKPLVLRGG